MVTPQVGKYPWGRVSCYWNGLIGQGLSDLEVNAGSIQQLERQEWQGLSKLEGTMGWGFLELGVICKGCFSELDGRGVRLSAVDG